MYRSLRKSAEFQRAFRHGTRRRCGGVLVIRVSGYPGPPRVGFVVGRKVGGAVRRNRARRRLREALREVPLEQGSDYVIVASASVADAPFASLIGWLKGGVAGEETKA